jgi:hypothetical protein
MSDMSALERALRAGPPDESGYIALPIDDPGPDEVRADGSYLAVERVVPTTRARSRISATGHSVGRWVAFAAAAALAVGLVVGRTTAPAATGTTGGTPAPLVRPAFVADPLSNAWARASINLTPSLPALMVCGVEPVLTCHTVAPTDLGPAQNAGQPAGLPPTTPVGTYWGRLKALMLPEGHLAGALEVPGTPDGLDVRLISLDAPPNSPGVIVDTVYSDVPGYFFDLGSVAPGSYAIVVATNSTNPRSELYAVGLVVGGR